MRNFDSKNNRNLIIGVDPGITCGLAVIDFDANLIVLKSKRATTINEIIHQVTDLGRPMIVASDVRPTPGFVKKVASKLNALIFVPKVLMKEDKKRELVQKYMVDYDERIKDTHTGDALAAALKAYNYYKDKFLQIEFSKKNSQMDLDKIRGLVIKGMKIKEAIDSLKKEKKIDSTITIHQKRKSIDKKIRDNLIKKSMEIKKLKTENKKLIDEIKRLEFEILKSREFTERKNKEFESAIMKDRLIQLQKKEIKSLNTRLRKLESPDLNIKEENIEVIEQLEAERKIIFLKPIRKFSFSYVNEAINKFCIASEDVPILLDASGGGRSAAQSLIDVGIKAIVTCTTMSHHAEDRFIEKNVPVLPSKQIEIKWIRNKPYVVTKAFDKAIQRIQSILLNRDRFDEKFFP